MNNNILWKRIGTQSGFKVGFRSFDITLKQNSIVSSNIAGSLFIPKFTDSSGNPAQIDVFGHLECNGDFLLTASAVPPFDPKITWPNVFTLHLNTVELGKEGDKFFIGASADVEFLGYLGTLLNIGELVIQFAADGEVWKLAGGPVPLKRTGTYLKLLKDILIVQQFFHVNTTKSFIIASELVTQNVESFHDSFHPVQELHFIDFHNFQFLEVTYFLSKLREYYRLKRQSTPMENKGLLKKAYPNLIV